MGKLKILVLTILAALLQLSSTSPASEGKGSSVPVIILKLDDITQSRIPKGKGICARWQKCLDFLKSQKIPACFGIIGASLEKDNQNYFDWIKETARDGSIEFWNHGYHLRSGKDPKGEFEVNDMNKQKEALEKTQKLAKEKLGLELTSFGPHWSGTNNATVEALNSIPEIKIVFFYAKPTEKSGKFVFERSIDLEKPIFRPNPEFIKERFEKWGHRKPYIAMQGHPAQWDDARFENFKKAVLYLKGKGCKFMTASEYVNSLNK